jgi:beta-glucanase (GH16 family)
MMQLVLGRRASVVRPRLKRKLSQLITSRKRQLKNTGLVVLTVLGLAIVAAATIMPLTGIRLISHGTSADTVASVTKRPSTPQIVGAASGCKEPAHTTATLFASCPSFVADYAKQKSGKINADIFNVYQGAPFANGEVQYYINDTQNLRVENGSLVLQARNQAMAGYNYTSARIDTKHRKDFLYGKFVIRAQLPSGVGTWPAIWMLPSDPKYASLSSATDATRYLNDGEIDIVEAIGSQQDVNYSVAHSLSYDNNGVDRRFFNTVTVPNSTLGFHEYEMDWTPTQLKFSVDGRLYFVYNKQSGATYSSWPYDQPFYLVANLALGGSWAGQDRARFPADGVDSSALPASLKIQSIRYYSYIGQ